MNNDERFETASDYGFRAYRPKGKGFRYGQKIHVEDLPKKEPIVTRLSNGWDRHHSWDSKGIRRMLRSGIGKPWAKVHSLMVAHVKDAYPENARHEVMRYVMGCVEVHPMNVGDGQYVQENGQAFYTFSNADNLYVDPKDGILKRVPTSWTKIRFESPKYGRRYFNDQIKYVEHRYFRKIDGIWYEIELVNLPCCDRNDWNNTADSWKQQKESDWLWILNIYDVVMKERLSSWQRYHLASCHGYRTNQNKMVSPQQYQEMVAKQRTHYFYQTGGFYCPAEKFIYAKSMQQVSKKDIKLYQLNANPLKLPNIVR